MPTTTLKPNILGPKIPGVLAIGLLAAQFLIFGQGNQPDAACTLKIDQVHISKSVPIKNGLSSIKLNVTSSCNQPQKSTHLDVSILKIAGNQEIKVFTFKDQVRIATSGNQNSVKFLDLFRQCTSNSTTMFSGEAKGEVTLKTGKTIPVSGKSDKFIALPCEIEAK